MCEQKKKEKERQDRRAVGTHKYLLSWVRGKVEVTETRKSRG